jgi:LuxR family maltose regulon positive regulatory protein
MIHQLTCTTAPDTTRPGDIEGWFGPPGPLALHVPRQRLLDRLDQAAEVPLVLVAAPPGWGKTTLVSDWAARQDDATIAWISFEQDDRCWWPGLVACIAELGVPTPSPELFAAPDGVTDRHLLTSLALSLTTVTSRSRVVVDCALPPSPTFAAELDFLLRRSRATLQVVLLTRADLTLPLHRYRLDGSVLELTAADLAFTDREAESLLADAGVRLAPGTARALNRRARGWAAGLRFAARRLAEAANPDRAVADVRGDRDEIAGYLLAEVLDAQPSQVRRIMLRTSVPDVLQPGLTEALGGPSAPRALAQLARANVFVEQVPRRAGSYRYHPFLHDLLRAELALDSPKLARSLQRRAAQWYAAHGLPGVPAARWPEQASEPAPPSLLEPLTDRELEVLGHLAELITTDEIASTMFVSVNTIRTHVRSILRKLGVSRRNAAVRRARDLGLLPGWVSPSG